jgi:arylformamidase
MREDFKIIDISLPIAEGMILYPFNPLVELEGPNGDTSFLTKITLGSHTGTHLDAPRHVFPDGKGVETLGLSALVGPCRVIDLSEVDGGITTQDLEKQHVKPHERILVKTKNSHIGFEQFRPDFIFLEGSAAEYLGSLPITLFGIDYISVKEYESSDDRAHTALLSQDIPIIEGINLDSVKPDNYFLVALPLRFGEIDGSPLRAILLQNY